MPKKWYAVRVGRARGIYRSWEECKEQIHQYSGAQFSSFPSRAQALLYLEPTTVCTANSSSSSSQMRDGESSEKSSEKSKDESKDESKESTQQPIYVLCVDGASKGNPGPAGSGGVAFVETGSSANEKEKEEERRTKLFQFFRYHGTKWTSVQAEYAGLWEGLYWLHQLVEDRTHARISIFMDSQLVVNQVLGHNQVRALHLQPICQAIREMLQTFGSVTLQHIERSKNVHADALANLAVARETNRLEVWDERCLRVPKPPASSVWTRLFPFRNK